MPCENTTQIDTKGGDASLSPIVNMHEGTGGDNIPCEYAITTQSNIIGGDALLRITTVNIQEHNSGDASLQNTNIPQGNVITTQVNIIGGDALLRTTTTVNMQEHTSGDASLESQQNALGSGDASLNKTNITYEIAIPTQPDIKGGDASLRIPTVNMQECISGDASLSKTKRPYENAITTQSITIGGDASLRITTVNIQERISRDALLSKTNMPYEDTITTKSTPIGGDA